MAWCHHATSHYQNQCWPRSISSSSVASPQWVTKLSVWYVNQQTAIQLRCIWDGHTWCVQRWVSPWKRCMTAASSGRMSHTSSSCLLYIGKPALLGSGFYNRMKWSKVSSSRPHQYWVLVGCHIPLALVCCTSVNLLCWGQGSTIAWNEVKWAVQGLISTEFW